jgi:hypothetical protein
MMDNGNRPAVPASNFPMLSEINHQQLNIGLTKREYFAGLAMQSLATNEPGNENFSSWLSLAGEAVELADAMLVALDADNG